MPWRQAALLSDSNIDLLAATTEALHLVPAEPVSPLRARVSTCTPAPAPTAAATTTRPAGRAKALTLARELGLADVLADATTTLARLDERAGDPESSRARRSRRPSPRRGPPASWPPSCAACSTSAALHYEHGQLDEALAGLLGRRWRAPARPGRPWAPYGVDARAMVGDRRPTWRATGTSSRAPSTSSGESPPGWPRPSWPRRAAVAAGRGERSALDLAADAAAVVGARRDDRVIIAGAAIDLHGDAGELDAASRACDRATSKT